MPPKQDERTKVKVEEQQARKLLTLPSLCRTTYDGAADPLLPRPSSNTRASSSIRRRGKERSAANARAQRRQCGRSLECLCLRSGPGRAQRHERFSRERRRGRL